MSRTRSLSTATLCCALLVAACSDDASQDTKVLIDDTEIAGSSRGELLRDYIGMILAVPADDNMLVDPSVCDMGRSTDDVYFAPTWGAPGDSTASCAMKASQALFLNPVGAFCFEDETDAADQACVDREFNLTSAEVLIDGEPVDDLASSLVQFDPQDIETVEGNLLEVEAGPVTTIGKGYVVVVEGLATGDHEVVLRGDFGDGEFAGSLTIDLVVE